MLSTEDILSIINMRMAVYSVGASVGAWKNIDASGASDMMTYLFPKSGKLAYYQLIMEQVKANHDMFSGGVYFLFKLPVQAEKEILDFLRSEEIDIDSYKSQASEYLAKMDTIPTDHTLTAVNIGSFSVQDLDNLLRLCASHYRYSFSNQLQSYPYFE